MRTMERNRAWRERSGRIRIKPARRRRRRRRKRAATKSRSAHRGLGLLSLRHLVADTLRPRREERPVHAGARPRRRRLGIPALWLSFSRALALQAQRAPLRLGGGEQLQPLGRGTRKGAGEGDGALHWRRGGALASWSSSRWRKERRRARRNSDGPPNGRSRLRLRGGPIAEESLLHHRLRRWLPLVRILRCDSPWLGMGERSMGGRGANGALGAWAGAVGARRSGLIDKHFDRGGCALPPPLGAALRLFVLLQLRAHLSLQTLEFVEEGAQLELRVRAMASGGTGRPILPLASRRG